MTTTLIIIGYLVGCVVCFRIYKQIALEDTFKAIQSMKWDIVKPRVIFMSLFSWGGLVFFLLKGLLTTIYKRL
jgi:hypothetical protein